MVAAVMSAAAAAPAAGPLYSNGSADPATPALAAGNVSASGVAAPAGSKWSELQRDAAGYANAIAGFSAHALEGGTGYRFADDFTVPAGGWRLSSVSLFAYQSGGPVTSFPFDIVTLRIWNGRPGDAGSQVIWGDAVTNRYLGRSPAGIYRTFSTAALPLPTPPDTQRMIWKVEASLGNVSLGPGRYWLDWQYGFTGGTSTRAMVPAVTIAGSRGAAGSNAVQLGSGTGAAWTPIVDTGKPESAADVPQDLPFILVGISAPPVCAGDINGDFRVDGRDLSVLLANFGSTVAPGTSGDVNNTGRVDGADISVLLSNFGNQC